MQYVYLNLLVHVKRMVYVNLLYFFLTLPNSDEPRPPPRSPPQQAELCGWLNSVHGCLQMGLKGF